MGIESLSLERHPRACATLQWVPTGCPDCRFSRTRVPSSSSLSSCNAALSPSLASAACAAPSGLSIGRSGLDNLRSAGTTKSPYRAAISSTTAGCFVVASWAETVPTSPSSVTHFCARSVPLEHPSDATKTAVTDRRAQTCVAISRELVSSCSSLMMTCQRGATQTTAHHGSLKPGSRSAFLSNVRVWLQPAWAPSSAIKASANAPRPCLSATMAANTSCSFSTRRTST